MLVLKDILSKSLEYVQRRNPRIERFEVELLIAELLGLKRLDLYLAYDKPLAEPELELIRSALQRLIADEPVAYILGYTHFYGLKINVTPSVLIPRPETELLVEAVLKKIQPTSVVVDVCCGSGCIGLAVSHAAPHARVISSDISLEALQVAQDNANRLGLDVEYRQSDLFDAIPLEEADVILINPPYVSSEEYSALDPSVRKFEPKLALVGGELGVEFYERIMRELPLRAKKGALVGLELGAGQSAYFKQAVYSKYNFEFIKDYQQHERHVLFSVV